VSSSGSDLKAQVLQATDIVDLIGQSVALKRRGRSLIGLCPFHNEKTPSFHVHPDRQFFYCFGCKASGNAIDFVMKRDRLEFVEALKLLAQRAGIEVKRLGGSKESASERQQLLDAHSAAAQFFENQLSDPTIGKAAREYLAKRGFTEESIRRFRIGVAPDAWDTLLRGPVGRKFPPGLLALGGLLKARESGGHYDTFRNRLMFPIRDENGRVIAFGGRAMPGSPPDIAKYLNSPETPLFSKSRCAFGLDLAKQRIVETRTVAVVEGYTDVVMAHQFGVSNVVSVLGTAMTEQHVALLRRFADRIVLLFDPDEAGDTAVDRVIELFLTQPVEMAIAQLPDGLDPDEFLLKHGAEAFEQILTEAADALSFKWRQLTRWFMSSAGDLTGQQKAVSQYVDLLAQARLAGPIDAIRWGSAIARVSRLTGIDVETLNRRLKSVKRSGVKPLSSAVSPARPAAEAAAAPMRPGVSGARERAERSILGILLLSPEYWRAVQQHIAPQDFTDDLRRALAEAYWSHQRDEGEPVFNEFLGLLPSPELRELAIELERECSELKDGIEQVLNDSVTYLVRVIQERHEQMKLLAELKRTGDEGRSEEDEVALLRQLQEKARKPDVAGRL
jgi:DNA primase